MKEIEEKILSLRKELREDYSRITKRLYLINLEIDNYLKYLQEGVKGG